MTTAQAGKWHSLVYFEVFNFSVASKLTKLDYKTHFDYSNIHTHKKMICEAQNRVTIKIVLICFCQFMIKTNFS